MSRLEFEEWLLNEAELDPRQQRKLAAELARNSDLTDLRKRLLSVDHVLQSVEMAEPRPGFVGRWRKRMQQEQKAAARRQNIAVAGFLSFVGTLALGVSAFLIFSSPAEIASSLLKMMVALRAQLAFVRDFLAAMADAIPGMMGMLVISGMLAALAWLSVAWITSLYRFAYLERRNGV